MSTDSHVKSFEQALKGREGDLDSWLELNNEADVRTAINGYVAAQLEARGSADPVRYYHINSGIDSGLYTAEQIIAFPSKYAPVYLQSNIDEEVIRLRKGIEAITEFTKPLSNFEAYQRLAMSPHQLINHCNELLAVPTPPSAETLSDYENTKLQWHSYDVSRVEQPDSAAPVLVWHEISDDSLARLDIGKATSGDQMMAANAIREAQVFADMYSEFADMIEPYVARLGKGGELPASVIESVEHIFQHWVATKDATKPPRITEQDARDIIDEFCIFAVQKTLSFHCKAWLESSFFSTLIAKLNEHREPDYKSQRDQLLSILNEIHAEIVLPSSLAEKAEAVIAKAGASTEVKP